MKAADLDDAWIGRTVAVHDARFGTSVGLILDFAKAESGLVAIRLYDRAEDVQRAVSVPGSTVITEQEVPW